MEIRCVLLKKEQQEQLIQCGWIPKELDIVPDEWRLFFGGLDEGKNLKAIAVYALSPRNRKNAALEYIFVQKRCRRQGVGTKLLQFSEEQLQLLGRKRLSCEWHGSEQDLENVTSFLQEAGFRPVKKPAHILVYNQGQFQGSELQKLQKTSPKLWKSVVRIDDYHELRMRRLLAQYETTGFYIEERDYDPELCRFYIEDGEIRAAACLRRMKNGDLTTMKGYLSPQLQNKFAMTLLIAVLINDLRTVLQPEIKIYLKLYRSNFYESVKKLFGEGQEEYLFREYERVIGGR